jgi:hypothetical protein
MFYQNSDTISKEHPRFVTTFYEYLIASRNRNTGTLKHTEKLIISNHLEHLPTAGIRNFLRAYADSGRGNMDVIEPVLNLLEEREAFKDIRMNLTVMDNLLRCRRMPEEYMFKSLDHFEQEYQNESKQGKLQIEAGERDF